MDKPPRNGYASIGEGEKPHAIPLLAGKLIRGETALAAPSFTDRILMRPATVTLTF